MLKSDTHSHSISRTQRPHRPGLDARYRQEPVQDLDQSANGPAEIKDTVELGSAPKDGFWTKALAVAAVIGVAAASMVIPPALDALIFGEVENNDESPARAEVKPSETRSSSSTNSRRTRQTSTTKAQEDGPFLRMDGKVGFRLGGLEFANGERPRNTYLKPRLIL